MAVEARPLATLGICGGSVPSVPVVASKEESETVDVGVEVRRSE